MSTREGRIDAAVGELRPALQADGADLRFLGSDGRTVRVELVLTDEACLDCVLPAEHLEQVILDTIRRSVPDVDRATLVDPRTAAGDEVPQ